jgi:hypothetical protein
MAAGIGISFGTKEVWKYTIFSCAGGTNAQEEIRWRAL